MKKQSNPPPPIGIKRPAPPPPPPARNIMGRSIKTKADDLFPIELADCPCGHKAETWRTFTSWIMVGCKKCGQAAAAHNNLEQAAHDWQRMTAATRELKTAR